MDVPFLGLRVEDLALPGEDVGLCGVMFLRTAVQFVGLGQEHFRESEGGDEVNGLFLLSLLVVVKPDEVGFVELDVDLNIFD